MPVSKKALLAMILAGVAGGLAFADEGPDAKRVLKQAASNQGFYVRETQAGNFLASQFAQRHQDWDTASQYIGRVLNYDPANMELQKRAMILAMGSGQTSRAIATARKIVEKDASDGLALLFVTLDDFSRQDYKGAISNLSAMPEGSMAEFIRPILTSWAKAGLGEFDASALNGDNPLDNYHALLIADFMGKDADTIETAADKVVTLSSVDSYELEKIADILAAHGKTKKAGEYYDLILAQQPENDAITAKKTSLKNGKPLANSSSMQTVQQGAGEAMFDMGRILFREMSNDSAMVFTRMALHLNPSLIEGRLMLAHILNRAELHDEAIDAYFSIPADSPYYKEAQHSAADLMERDGEADRAIKTLNELYNKSGDIEALILIGDLQRRAEKFAEAVDSYNRVEKELDGAIKEKYWAVLYARGMAYERLGNNDHAEKDLLAALKYQPDHPYLLNYLGYSWADQGKNLKRAKSMIEKAVALRPDDGYIADSLGWVLYREGDFAAALPHLEKAAEMQPYDPTINDHLGDVYWQVGRVMEARFQWRRAAGHSDDDKQTAEIKAKITDGIPMLNTPNTTATKQAKAAKDEDKAIKR